MLRVPLFFKKFLFFISVNYNQIPNEDYIELNVNSYLYKQSYLGVKKKRFIYAAVRIEM